LMFVPVSTLVDEEKGGLELPPHMGVIELENGVHDVGAPISRPGRALSDVPSMKIDVSKMSGPIRRYYEEQQELIGLLSHKPSADDDDDDAKKDRSYQSLVSIAIQASYASNIILLIVKIWALIISGSLAMLASVLDSCLDILSGSVLFCAQRIVDSRNKYKYPIGKNRAQPIATIIFACLMGMSALQVNISHSLSLDLSLVSVSLLLPLSISLSVCLLTLRSSSRLCVACPLV
jgi:hypothetical protein